MKAEARRRVLTSAVKALTLNRARSVVVRPREVEITLDYALRLLNDRELHREAFREFTEWEPLHRQLLGKKRADDLRVLYLAGPEPLNDLQVLLKLGVRPHNVWAVESGRSEFKHATQQLLTSDRPIKIYPGSLAEFVEFTSESFDILYIDGCASFGSGRPNTLGTLIQLLRHQRLAPLSALITTYAGIDASEHSWYPDILAAYFRYRMDDTPSEMQSRGLDASDCAYDDEALRSAIQYEPEPYYSEFITRFTVDLARHVVPTCRTLALTGMEQTLLADKKKRSAARESALRMPALRPGMSLDDLAFGIGDFHMNAAGYPVLSFLRTVQERSPKSPIWRQLERLKVGRFSLMDAMYSAALLENCVEGHWTAMGETLLNAIRLGWFDRHCHVSCDVPMPHLLVNTFIGIAGAPAHPNPKACERLRYTAKQTPMYADMLVFDRCRSFYDWFPTPHVAEARFRSRGFQLLARCILDRIGWADWDSSSHPFRGAAMAGMRQTKCAHAETFRPRTEL